jgi:serine/threonine protein kinase
MCHVKSALTHLLDLGLVYTDLKPNNIMLKREGAWCLIDFGDRYGVGYKATQGFGAGEWRTDITRASGEIVPSSLSKLDRYLRTGARWCCGSGWARLPRGLGLNPQIHNPPLYARALHHSLSHLPPTTELSPITYHLPPPIDHRSLITGRPSPGP